jgi:hypothetical protein
VNYLNLINSHFTWMAEGGWAVAVLYLFAWMTGLLLCWPVPGSRLKGVPLAVGVAFGVSGCFSHVAESLWLWIAPLLLLGYAVGNRSYLKRWPPLASAGICGVLSISAVAIVILIGFAGESLPLKKTGGAVTLGNGPNLNLIFVDRDVMGKLYGHALRKYLDENRDQLAENTFIITESPAYIMPPGLHEVIFSGRLMQDVSIAAVLNVSHQIIFINPGCYPGKTEWSDAWASRTAVYFGEYSQSPARSAWASDRNIKTLSIDGASDFVPSWPYAVLKPSGT